MNSSEINTQNINKPLILIVDDNPDNLQILASIIYRENYNIMVASGGEKALNMVQKVIPDLILLDIMMPDINGYDVCRNLKANEATKNIPIIFITALKETEEILKGFEVGGVDYVTKPFKHEELLARVKTQIELKRSRDTLIKQNEKLWNMRKEKSDFLSLAGHDLRNPLNGIAGISELIVTDAIHMPREEISLLAKTINKGANSLLRIISDFLDLNAIEDENLVIEPTNFDINGLILTIIENFTIALDNKKITIDFANRDDITIVYADRNRIVQIIDNLLSNAIKFSQRERKIIICSTVNQSENLGKPVASIEIIDEGQGIMKEEIHKLFTKYGRLSSRPMDREPSMGLGLYIAKRLADAMNCDLKCESDEGKGSKFILDIPIYSGNE